MIYYTIISSNNKEFRTIRFYDKTFVKKFQEYCIFIDFNPWLDFSNSVVNSFFYKFTDYEADILCQSSVGGFNDNSLKVLNDFIKIIEE